jgi:hypothetical protein
VKTTEDSLRRLILRAPSGLRITFKALLTFSVMVVLALLIDQSAWAEQTSDSWALPASGVLLVASVLGSATYVFLMYKAAQDCVEAGESVAKQLSIFAMAVVLAISGSVTIGNLMYTQLFSWYAARYEGLTAATVSLVEPAQAVSPPYQGIRVTGPMGLGTAAAVRALAMQSPNVQWIELNSHDGLAPEGINLGRLLHELKLTVMVPRECVGACIWALAGAPQLAIDETAELACYRPYWPMVGGGQTLTRADLKVKRWLSERGLSTSSLLDCLGAPKWEAIVLDSGTMLAAHRSKY